MVYRYISSEATAVYPYWRCNRKELRSP